jgi:hypothetical protein
VVVQLEQFLHEFQNPRPQHRHPLLDVLLLHVIPGSHGMQRHLSDSLRSLIKMNRFVICFMTFLALIHYFFKLQGQNPLHFLQYLSLIVSINVGSFLNGHV